MPRSNHRCPACHNPLTYLVEDSTVLVWCDAGRCPSGKANDGLKGWTDIDTVALKLIAQLKDDPDW